MRLIYGLAFGIVAAGGFGGALAGEPQGFTATDLVELNRVSDPQVSPDGRFVAFTMRETDRAANKGRTDIWLLEIDKEKAGPRRLTSHEASDNSARWAADGESIFFLSSRSGSSQVWRIAPGGGAAEQVTDLPLAVGNLVVSPGGARIAFSMEVFADCADIACTRARLDARAQRQATGVVYDKLFLRHWDTWKDGRRAHLFSLQLAEGSAPVDLSRALDGDVPSKPFGGPEEITFSADGSALYFALREAGRTEPWSTNWDIFRVSADGSSPPENLTSDNKAWDTAPAVSGDGRWLAWLAMARPGFEADRFRIMLRDLHNGETQTLADDWDRSPGSMAFAPDSQSLLMSGANLGQTSLWRIALADGARSMLVEKGNVAGVSASGDRVVFAWDDLASPADLYLAGQGDTAPRRLTAVNKARLADIRMGAFEQFTFAGWRGETVHGYVMKPANYVEGQKYPIAFLIHGGPQGSFGNHFHYRWNPQAYAGAGYAAVFIDFHGSVGYGQDFTDSISGDWGGKPLEDLQKGLAAALDRYAFLDGERICALGASYGGYMINWIAGKWPKRFDCLVNHDGIFDNRSMYYSTEELWFPEWEHGGPYYQNPKGHEKHNPVRHVGKWQTPMLVVHGGQDFRIPESQGIAAFTALQRRGVASRFLYFGDENHFVQSPANSLLWHREVLGWLDRWTAE